MTQHLRSRDALTTRAARPEPVRTAPRRTAGDLVRGLGAAALLLVLVAGIPALLLVVGQLHVVGMPSWSTVWGALTRPDDGHLFLAALTVLAWLAWATFTFSVIVEAIAIVRGLPSPRLPLLSVPQHAAAALVATAAVLLTLHPAPTATPAAATTGISVVLDAARTPAISVTAPHRSAAPSHAESRADAARPDNATQRNSGRTGNTPERDGAPRRHAVGPGREVPRRRHTLPRDRPAELRPTPARRTHPVRHALDLPRLGAPTPHPRRTEHPRSTEPPPGTDCEQAAHRPHLPGQARRQPVEHRGTPPW